MLTDELSANFLQEEQKGRDTYLLKAWILLP